MNIKKNKKAFTILELIVVIAVIGILVLLAMPSFSGYVEKAHLSHIKNDTKVAENVMDDKLIHKDKLPVDWEYVTDEYLTNVAKEDRLYETRGLVNVEKGIQTTNGEFARLPDGTFNTRLKGSFYSNQGGKVYYERNKAGKLINPGEPGNPDEKDPNEGGGEIDKIEIEVEKVWVGLKDGESTPNITIHLMNGETKVQTQELISGETKHTFTNVNKTNSEGVEILYTIKEDSVEGFHVSYSKIDDVNIITNTKVKSPIEEIEKELEDLKDKIDKEEIDDDINDKIIEVEDKIDKLPDGEKKEDLQEELDKIKDDISKLEKIEIKVKKIWEKLDTEEKVPNITINIMNGSVKEETVILKQGTTTHTFTGLDKYNTDGSEIQYTVIEEDVPGFETKYTKELNTTVITNTKIVKETNPDFIWVLDSSSLAYLAVNEVGRGYYKYVGDATTVTIPLVINDTPMVNYYKMFADNATIYKVIGNTDKKVRNMAYMFSGSTSTSLSLSALDTSNVYYMTGMFQNSHAQTFGFENWDVSMTVIMTGMFRGSRASSLNLNGWKTWNVINADYMFQDSRATTLYINNWDTQSLQVVHNMFYGSSVRSLDLSRWRTSKIKIMSQVFSSSSLTSLNVSGWSVSQVTNMHHLFAYTSLSTLDLSTWDFDSVRSGDFENFVAGNPINVYFKNSTYAQRIFDISGRGVKTYNQKANFYYPTMRNGSVDTVYKGMNYTKWYEY